MTVRADILAGRAVILVNIQDNIDKSLKTIRSKMRVFANNMSEIGGDLFRGGLAGSIAAIFPVKEFTSFQDSMLFLQSKLKDTGVDVKALEGLIRELGRTTSFTSREVAEAGAVLAQAGLGARVGATLQPTLDLARASRIDIDTAGRLLANVMASFNIDVDKASETASKLVTAARLGTTDVIDLGEALKYSITTFRQLGVPFEDALGMITQLSNVSMRASLAGTSLNAAFGNLAAKPDQLAKLGIVIDDFDLENPISMFTKLSAALSKLTRQEQAATLSQLFNIRGGRGFGGILIQDLDDLQMVINKIRNAGDEAREMALLMDSQLGGVGRRALSAFQEALISIGETTEGPLTKIGTNLQLIFQNIGNLTKANPRLVQTMLAIPPIALATGVSFLLLSTAISKMLMLVGPLLSANALIFKSLGAIAGANINVAKTMFDAGRIGMMSMGTITGPSINFSGMIKGGAAGIGRGATALGSGFATAFTKAAQSKIATNAKWMLSPLLSLAPMIHTIGRGLSSAFLLSGGVATPRSFMDIAKATYAIYSNISKVGFSLREVATGASLLAGQFAVAARNAVLINQMRIGDTFRGMRSGLKGMTLEKAFTSPIANAITNGITKGLLAFNKIAKASPTMKGITQLGNVMFGKQFGKNLNVSLGTQLSAAFGNLAKGGPGRAIASFWNVITKGFKAFGRAVVNTNWLAKLISGFQGLWTAAKGFFTILNGIRRALFSLSGLLIVAEVLIIFGDKIPIIKDALAGLGKAFSNAFANIGNMFRDIAGNFNWFQNGLRSIFTGDIELGLKLLGNGFRGVGKAITEGVSYTWQNFVKDIEPGAMMIRNAIKGIIAVFEALVATIGAVFGTAFEKGAILVKSDGSLLELFQSIFSPENFQQFFAFVVSFIGEVGKGLITLVEFIGNVLIDIKKVFMAILEGIAKLPILGDAARAGLEATDDPNDPNAARIRALRAGIASREDILSGVSGQFVSDLERKRIENIIAAARRELASLGVSSPTAKPPAQLRSELQTSIDEILAGMQDITNPLAVRPPLNDRDRWAAEAAAEFGGATSTMTPDFLEAEAGALSNVMGMLNDDLEAERNRLRRDIWNLPDIAEAAPQLAAAKSELAPIGQAIKAVVGDFESTRYRQLQFSGKKLDEDRNKLLGDIDDGIARVEDKLQQPAFA